MGKYSGEFKAGLKDGKGVFLFKTGIKYIGYYKEGVKEGRGTIYG